MYVSDTGTDKGRGVFAACAFSKGEVVEIAPVLIMRMKISDLPEDLRKRVFDWTVLANTSADAHALAFGYGSMYNHDDVANLRYEAVPPFSALRFTADRSIKKHEELTINYDAKGGGTVWHDSNWFDRMKVKKITNR